MKHCVDTIEERRLEMVAEYNDNIQKEIDRHQSFIDAAEIEISNCGCWMQIKNLENVIVDREKKIEVLQKDLISE